MKKLEKLAAFGIFALCLTGISRTAHASLCPAGFDYVGLTIDGDTGDQVAQCQSEADGSYCISYQCGTGGGDGESLGGQTQTSASCPPLGLIWNGDSCVTAATLAADLTPIVTYGDTYQGSSGNQSNLAAFQTVLASTSQYYIPVPLPHTCTGICEPELHCCYTRCNNGKQITVKTSCSQ